MLLLPMKLPIAIPMPIESHGPQVEHRLCPGFRPAHPGLLHAIFHQMPTGAFDDPRANRPALGEVLVVAHIRAVAPVVADRAPDGLPLGRRAHGIVGLRFQGGDHGLRLAGQRRGSR